GQHAGRGVGDDGRERRLIADRGAAPGGTCSTARAAPPQWRTPAARALSGARPRYACVKDLQGPL
ncbi:hypothetical protein, partial [Burkholderia vietnamiensis]|uniref:hypothetical protein n=1 Tax=Burkholderia vietnamiensis TaxID=60552 RepID=UPI001BA1244A